MSLLSQKLDTHLSLKKMSKKQLALELGISINTLGKWWGSREPSPKHATKIQQLLQEDTSSTITVVNKNSISAGNEAKNDEAVIRQPTLELLKQGEAHIDRSTVVSFLRTRCPFCRHKLERFQHCAHCGQRFVWANVPLSNT
ncbi:multiprotein-bridging factor 1 family protein [Chloroflexota bacterium]